MIGFLISAAKVTFQDSYDALAVVESFFPVIVIIIVFSIVLAVIIPFFRVFNDGSSYDSEIEELDIKGKNICKRFDTLKQQIEEEDKPKPKIKEETYFNEDNKKFDI